MLIKLFYIRLLFIFSFQKIRPVNTIELAKQLTIGAIVTTSCTIQLEFSDMVFDQISAYVLDWVISHDSPLKIKMHSKYLIFGLNEK